MRVLVTNISDTEIDLSKIGRSKLLLGEDTWVVVPDDYVFPDGVLIKKIHDQSADKEINLVSAQLLTVGYVEDAEARNDAVNTSKTALSAKVAK